MASVTQKGGGSDLLRVRPVQRFDAEHLNRHIHELNAVLARVDERLRGTGGLKLSADLDANGFQIKNLATATKDSDVVTMGAFRDTFDTTIVSEVEDVNSSGDALSIIGGESSTSLSIDNVNNLIETTIRAHFKAAEFTVDVGPTPTRTALVVVPDGNVQLGTFVLVTQLAQATNTGKSADESEMDPLVFETSVTQPLQFNLYINTINGPVTGAFRISYVVSTI